MSNLRTTVDSLARGAIARNGKDTVFTETVREQVKEVGKTAEAIYNQLENVGKTYTNSVAGVNMLHAIHQWVPRVGQQLDDIAQKLEIIPELQEGLRFVVDFLRTCPALAPGHQLPHPT